MAFSVICVSRSLAAGGEEVARIVAKELGYRYVDEEIIVQAAERAGVTPEAVAKAEHTPSLVVRLLEQMGRTPLDPEAMPVHAMVSPDAASGYQSLIEGVVRETANEGDVVIVAHGASMPLAGTAGLLRVLVTAPPEVRAARLAAEGDMSEDEAGKQVRDSDGQRRQYLRRFYGVRDELPTLYDLVVNTDVVAVPLAAQLVVAAARGE